MQPKINIRIGINVKNGASSKFPDKIKINVKTNKKPKENTEKAMWKGLDVEIRFISLPAHNEPVEKPVARTTFLPRPFCLLFVINSACFWWEFQDKIYVDVNLLL
ncbi:hypothetical protein GCM10010919_29080 [Alishewanella longhuensis]|uniref:Uncharacterized protein n=1 Tax=Alishewanella longhuensis TaxID=1091037 RepID=A0ABQ3L3J8_9ALTE|nr:hypothetical protein GCM10010919_29080 [Alishewanella longhuensis]